MVLFNFHSSASAGYPHKQNKLRDSPAHILGLTRSPNPIFVKTNKKVKEKEKGRPKSTCKHIPAHYQGLVVDGDLYLHTGLDYDGRDVLDSIGGGVKINDALVDAHLWKEEWREGRREGGGERVGGREGGVSEWACKEKLLPRLIRQCQTTEKASDNQYPLHKV